MASRGVNKVILIGRLGADPEIRYMPNGNAVANLSLATSETWKDKTSGEPVERTEWHKVVFFGRVAEVLQQYARKGSSIYLEGSLRTRKWTDNSGAERYTTEVVGGDMQLLGGGSGSGSSSGASSSAVPAPASADDDGGFDDDIPFG